MNHVTYRGYDAVEKFIDHLIKLEDKFFFGDGGSNANEAFEFVQGRDKGVPRMQLNATSTTKNWEKISFVITVT